MGSANSRPQGKEENGPHNIEEYKKFVKEASKLILSDLKCGKNDDIVAFIGGTKAGKSTLINCLKQNALLAHCDEGTGDTYLTQVHEGDGPKIGNQAESETYEPAPFGLLGGTNWPMWDFPGFYDNKGDTSEVANAINIHTVLTQAKSVRLVLVVPFREISDADPMPFFRRLHDVFKLSDQISRQICLVGSMNDKGNLKVILEAKLTSDMASLIESSPDKKEIVENAKDILLHVLNNERYFHFKAPENVGQYEMKNHSELVDAIRRTEGHQMSQCNNILSDKAKIEINKCYNSLSPLLPRWSEIYVNCINEWVKKEMDSSDNVQEPKLHLQKCDDKLNEFCDTKNILENIYNLAVVMNADKKVERFTKVLDVLHKVAKEVQSPNNDVKRSENMFDNKIKESLYSNSNKISKKIIGILEGDIKKKTDEIQNIKEHYSIDDANSKKACGSKLRNIISDNHFDVLEP